MIKASLFGFLHFVLIFGSANQAQRLAESGVACFNAAFSKRIPCGCRNPFLGERRNKLWFLFSLRECFSAANSHSKHISDTDRRRSVSSQSDLQSDKNTR